MSEKYRLLWRDYNYLPYEIGFALREVNTLLNRGYEVQQDNKPSIDIDEADLNKINRLAYFTGASNGKETITTIQSRLENSGKKQSTRYSSHGLHEYKGKFNPQVVRGILNFLGIEEDKAIFDPFCGSGTTLLESFHMGISAVGTDINPLAVYLANAKVKALKVPAEDILDVGRSVINQFNDERHSYTISESHTDREEYLLKWFPKQTYKDIELLYSIIDSSQEDISPILFTIVSNILRDYSLQEPADLRIRKRKSPLPEKPLIEAFRQKLISVTKNIREAQLVLGTNNNHTHNVAYHVNNKELGEYAQEEGFPKFSGAITSPPYATALPYIDTQRLSLVWLGLCSPKEILDLEADLTGSREVRGKKQGAKWKKKMLENSEGLPEQVHNYCVNLQNSLSEEDGFRRQAVPLLLYRYFSSMYSMFQSVFELLSEGAPFALIVGHNHTTLGGTRFDINTSSLLVNVAVSAGWVHEESVGLQTYKRYGLHHKNATTKETLIILRK